MTYNVWVEYQFTAASEDCHTAPLKLQYAISGASPQAKKRAARRRTAGRNTQ